MLHRHFSNSFLRLLLLRYQDTHWSSERDRLSDEQVALHKSQLRRLSDRELRRSHEMYVRALARDKGDPTVAAKVQYFMECWRELRRRRRRPTVSP